MKLSVVIPVLGQHELAKLAIDMARHNAGADVEFVVIDQGGDFELKDSNPTFYDGVDIYRPGKNIGVYPTFKYGMEVATGDVVLFIHSDLLINEPEYDKRLLAAFESHDNLGLAGFIGSNEIDYAGGRGSGTTSNFQGLDWDKWKGSPAEAHGRRTVVGYEPAAVVDGCAMAIRRTAWDKIGYRAGFPPHHFYDRLISTQMLEAGYRIFVIGVACDHISGQTVNSSEEYKRMAVEWMVEKGVYAGGTNVDEQLYKEAERQWLREYRDIKHLVPIRV